MKINIELLYINTFIKIEIKPWLGEVWSSDLRKRTKRTY